MFDVTLGQYVWRLRHEEDNSWIFVGHHKYRVVAWDTDTLVADSGGGGGGHHGPSCLVFSPWEEWYESEEAVVAVCRMVAGQIEKGGIPAGKRLWRAWEGPRPS